MLVLGDIEIELGDVGVQYTWGFRRESVALKIETIASASGRVRSRVLLKHVDHIGIGAAISLGVGPRAGSVSRCVRVEGSQLRGR